MYTYKLTIAYEGTHYSGWQIQLNASSVQQHLQEALSTFLGGEKVIVIGSGRTDAGVHAMGQIAHFKWVKELDLKRLRLALNSLLPRDIRVKQVQAAAIDFHAQYSAIGKEYHYYLYLDPVMNPFRRLYCWHIQKKFNVGLLEEAATFFVGKHDFTSFANEAHAGTAAHDPIRTLYRLDVKPFEGGVCLEFEGNGFLYKMVRNIVGTLVEVASYKRSLEDIAAIFVAKDRRRAGESAPPQGLFLMHVYYPADHLIEVR